MNQPVMTLPRRPPPAGDRVRGGGDPRRPGRGRHGETLILFAVSAVVYLVMGGLLIHFNVVFTDAISRVANAFYVLFSRDPHLPAMGFVWNPLPSFVVLPILPLKVIFPGLVVYGAAGAIQSALSMAGVVAVISVCLRKLGVSRLPRLVLVALFAVQPMILLYGGSGQSEPMMLLFLMLTASALISWTQQQHTGHLVAAGIALGLAYLTRYESGATAVAVTAFVGSMTVFKATGTVGHRIRLAVNDVALVLGPFLFAFVFWAASAKLLVGEWFPTFGSKYGNSAQVADAAHWIQQATGTGFGQTLAYLSRQTLALSPLFAALLIAAVGLGVHRRDLTVVVAPVVFGSVMAFCGLILLVGSSFGWLRFQITVIPLTVLLAGSIVASLTAGPGRKTGVVPAAGGGGWVGRRRALTATVAVVVAVVVAVPVQAWVLTQPTLNLAREEAPMLSGLVYPARPGSDPSRLQMFKTEHRVGAYLDRLDPGAGTVLADSAYAFPIITSSTKPRMFVISSDFDFQGAVDNPSGHAIKYVLVRSDARSDAVQVKWPQIYDTGAGIATLVQKWDGVVGQWRLYRFH